LRYFDYANTQLFGQPLRDGGLGWRSVFAVAVGGQYALSDRLTLRGGYLFNTNPIPSIATLFNVQLPAIIEHTLSLGVSARLTDDITFTAGWVHGFRNSLRGTIAQETGAFTRFDTQYDSILAGFNVQFGGSRRPPETPPPDQVAAAAAEPTSAPRE
jgi:long-chain fatty acid transport protein